MSRKTIVGALLGWKRAPSEAGVVFTLQVLTPENARNGQEYDRVSIAMNDRQLRSLARDLARAASERGIALRATPKWWQRLFWRANS